MRRSHARRALYLSICSHALAAHKAFRRQQLVALHNDPARPALLLHLPQRPAAGGGAAAAPSPRLCLRLLLMLPRDAFAPAKLAPDRNNVRWVTAAATSAAAAPGASSTPAGAVDGSGDAAAAQLPTPQYNAGLLADMLALPHHEALTAAMKAAPGLRNGLLLLKVSVACRLGVQGTPHQITNDYGVLLVKGGGVAACALGFAVVFLRPRPS